MRKTLRKNLKTSRAAKRKLPGAKPLIPIMMTCLIASLLLNLNQILIIAKSQWELTTTYLNNKVNYFKSGIDTLLIKTILGLVIISTLGRILNQVWLQAMNSRNGLKRIMIMRMI
jgi:hypothetical protein